jgi:uncharacterized protein (TIGR02145 family)
MPVSLWSDTVWVFVDYNHAGKMERLPITGVKASAGTATTISGNDKGAWIAGNARTTGNFSATVQLFTTANNVGGACVYASNYPPVGEYVSDTEISFTGTPMYDIVLKRNDGNSTVTVQSGSMLLLPCDYSLTSFTDATAAPGIIENYCTAPGSTVNFTAFNPCDAVAGATWTLQDTREPNNPQNYKVKKMTDGHIWMVQDLKFGDKCNKTTFSGSNGKDQQEKVSSVFPLHYGDCSVNRVQGGGYFYDWAAVINKPGAYNGASSKVGCSGTGSSANACQGICPYGWHVPTGNTDGEVYALLNSSGFCNANSNCWINSPSWEGVGGGLMESCSVYSAVLSHWLYTSTDCSGTGAYAIRLGSSRSPQDMNCGGGWPRCDAYTVRCIKNH